MRGRGSTGAGAAIAVSGMLLLGSARAPAQATKKAVEGKTMSMTLTSPKFSDGGQLPRACTCEGEDASPPLAWSGVPAGTQSLVLIVDDPDAPDPKAPKRTWVHWVIYNLPPSTQGLSEDQRRLPNGAREGLTDSRRTGWGGPCPPIGRHRYFFKLYALDRVLPDLGKGTKADVERAMKGHVLAEAQLMGTYQKGDR